MMDLFRKGMGTPVSEVEEPSVRKPKLGKINPNGQKEFNRRRDRLQISGTFKLQYDFAERCKSVISSKSVDMREHQNYVLNALEKASFTNLN